MDQHLLRAPGARWESRLDRRTDCKFGVRVVEGRHRTYISDFIRDARAGGCAIGTPPTNLGFRLVREDDDSSQGARLYAKLVRNLSPVFRLGAKIAYLR